MVDASEVHGRAMLTVGICDLRVSEMIYRIVQPGDYAIDVGANIGAMSSIMARRAGVQGRIYAIEPHPQTRARLSENVILWSTAAPTLARVEILPHALSNKRGTAFLEEPEGFELNSGTARFSDTPGQLRASGKSVTTEVFDDIFRDAGQIRLVKIDVEGHEDQIFDGMHKSLSNGSIDFIIFEEFRQMPSPACNFLHERTYSTYLIDRNFLGPRLIPTSARPHPISGESTNVLAVHPRCNIAELEVWGWQCLRLS